MALSIVGASATISSVMPVSSVIFSGMGIPGLTKVLKRSSTLPSRMRTAPISVMPQFDTERPVVSMSKTTNSLSSRLSQLPWSARAVSSTK